MRTETETADFHATLARASADIRALGLQVSDRRVPGATPYLVLGGRSNARWWLIPLVTRGSAASGFALFQPQLSSARVMKALGVVGTVCGLPWLARRSSTWCVVGHSILAQHFPETSRPVFAYFTGTDGPHRKLTAQVMDRRGSILGYSKCSTDPVVRQLIAHEAATLEQLRHVNLQSAIVPAVRFAGEVEGTYILATDTRKTFWTPSDSSYGLGHRSFLRELLERTRQPDAPAGNFAALLLRKWQPLKSGVERAWQKRIEASLAALDRCDDRIPVCLSHGDFTPWNTYRVAGRLYVFDWEYADLNGSAACDAIHFIHSQPRLWRADARARIAASEAELRCLLPDATRASIQAMHLVYALTQTLRVIEKMFPRARTLTVWDGADVQAALIDQLVSTS